MSSSPLDEGLALLKLAIEKDKALLIDEAIELYTRSIELLKYAHANLLGNARVLMLLPSKIQQFSRRVEYLKQQQKQLQSPPENVPASPAFSSEPAPPLSSTQSSAVTPFPSSTSTPGSQPIFGNTTQMASSATPSPYPVSSSLPTSMPAEAQQRFTTSTQQLHSSGYSPTPYTPTTLPQSPYNYQTIAPLNHTTPYPQQMAPCASAYTPVSHTTNNVSSLPAMSGAGTLQTKATPFVQTSASRTLNMRHNNEDLANMLSDALEDNYEYLDSAVEELEDAPVDVPDGPNFGTTTEFSQFHEAWAPSPYKPADVDFFKQEPSSTSNSFSSVKPGEPTARAGHPTSQRQRQVIDGVVYQSVTPNSENTYSKLQMKSDLQVAIDFALQAVEADKKRNYREALELYKQAIEHFFIVANADINQQVKTSLTSRIKSYITRAEQLKSYLQEIGELPMNQPEQGESLKPLLKSTKRPAEEDVAEPPRPDFDIRVGPLVKEGQTSFWNDSSPLFMRVDIRRNLVHPGESFWINVFVQNRSKVKVARLRVYIKQMELTTVIDVNAKKKVSKREQQINLTDYTEGGIFPMAQNTYEGNLEFIVPAITMPTDADFSTSFSREHFLVVMCDIPRHNDLILEFPIRILKPS